MNKIFIICFFASIACIPNLFAMEIAPHSLMSGISDLEKIEVEIFLIRHEIDSYFVRGQLDRAEEEMDYLNNVLIPEQQRLLRKNKISDIFEKLYQERCELKKQYRIQREIANLYKGTY